MRKLILAIVVFLPAAAFAGGYVVPNVNARDLGMAQAGVAAQDSSAAANILPASLARLDGLDISVDATLIDLRSTWSDSYGVYGPASPQTMIPKAVFPPAIYAAYGMPLSNGMRVGVGAGLTIPGGGFVFWPGDWTGNSEIISVDRRVYGMYLTGGVQVLPQLRLGGGLIYYRTTEHLIQGLNFLSERGQIELGTAGGALSYDLSAEAEPIKDVPLTIAVDYKHQGVMHLSGHAHGDDVPTALQPQLLDQEVTHTLTYPNQVHVAAAYKLPLPTPLNPDSSLLFAIDWEWDRDVVYRNDTFSGDRGVTVIVPRNYKNDPTFRFGVEYAGVIPKLRLRLGILRDLTGARPETASPTLPDADVTAVSAGIGYEVVPHFEINAGYFHAFYDTMTTVGTETFQGSYDTRTNIYSLSVVWKMPQSH